MKKKHDPAFRPEMCSADELLQAAHDHRLALHLLQTNLRRLELCARLEKERGICYPEGSVILRDCIRLKNILAGQPDTPASTTEADWT